MQAGSRRGTHPVAQVQEIEQLPLRLWRQRLARPLRASASAQPAAVNTQRDAIYVGLP